MRDLITYVFKAAGNTMSVTDAYAKLYGLTDNRHKAWGAIGGAITGGYLKRFKDTLICTRNPIPVP